MVIQKNLGLSERMVKIVNRLILFLIRKKLHLKKFQRFRFDNQKSTYDSYYFTSSNILKVDEKKGIIDSNVSLNWLLNDDCVIHKISL